MGELHLYKKQTEQGAIDYLPLERTHFVGIIAIPDHV
jgi:hypothetical protein